jgi:hypothetical protein
MLGVIAATMARQKAASRNRAFLNVIIDDMIPPPVRFRFDALSHIHASRSFAYSTGEPIVRAKRASSVRKLVRV